MQQCFHNFKTTATRFLPAETLLHGPCFVSNYIESKNIMNYSDCSGDFTLSKTFAVGCKKITV